MPLERRESIMVQSPKLQTVVRHGKIQGHLDTVQFLIREIHTMLDEHLTRQIHPSILERLHTLDTELVSILMEYDPELNNEIGHERKKEYDRKYYRKVRGENIIKRSLEK